MLWYFSNIYRDISASERNIILTLTHTNLRGFMIDVLYVAVFPIAMILFVGNLWRWQRTNNQTDTDNDSRLLGKYEFRTNNKREIGENVSSKRHFSYNGYIIAIILPKTLEDDWIHQHPRIFALSVDSLFLFFKLLTLKPHRHMYVQCLLFYSCEHILRSIYIIHSLFLC